MLAAEMKEKAVSRPLNQFFMEQEMPKYHASVFPKS
jgi:hypothetical protein